MKKRAYWQAIGLATAAVALRFTSEDQVRLAACRAASLQVTHRVTRGWHTFERHTKAAADLLKQPRQRLAAIAAFFGRVWAIKHRIYPASDSCEHFVHFGVHGVE